jgi:outer membrane protein TolC
MLSCLWILCRPLPAYSQKSVTTLPALIDSADHYLPSLLAKRALVNSATANITETRHQFLPAFRFSDQVNLGTDNSMAGSYFPYGLIPSTSSGIRAANDFQTVSGNLAVLYGEYTLLDFGYRSASVNGAKAEETFRKADFQKERYLIHARVCRSYFNLLLNQAKLEVEKQTVRRYDTIFIMIRALTMSGLRPGSDSSLAKTELSRSHITYNQIQEQAEQYREELAFLTGITTGQLNVDSSLMTSEVAAKKGKIAMDSIGNPLLDYYKFLTDDYLARERLISKSYLPKILLTAATWARGSSIVYDDQYKDLSTGLGYARYNWLAGISFQYDLFNGLHRKDRLKSFGFERESTERDLEQEKLNLETANRQAQNSINIAEKNLVEMPVEYRAAFDTYNQKLAQYKAGLIALIDLTNAAFVLDRSQNDYVETIGSWYQAQLARAIAIGNLDGFINSIR